MITIIHLIRRNLKLFFKDKGLFFPSLITPIILLVLYATFLADVYRDSFANALPDGMTISEKTLDSIVTCQLISSLLAVSCVTVSFCANLIMINDKSSGAIRDILVSPVKKSYIAIGYYISASLSTLIVTFTALGISFVYLATQGWCLSISDVVLIICDVLLLTLFGTALSSVINFFLSTGGQASAVGTIVSSGYGFICGAYMPIASFSPLLRKIIMFLPGTYGTSLIRNHFMLGALGEMKNTGFTSDAVEKIKDGIDCNLYFFEKNVPLWVMAVVLVGAVAIFTLIYVVMNIIKKKVQ